MFSWLTSLRVRLDWLFNSFLNGRHPATMILKSYGFSPTSFLTRRAYSVWRDGFRLCQLQEIVIPAGDIRLLMRIRLYVAHERLTNETPNPLYRVYWSFHLLDKARTPLLYAFMSEPFVLKKFAAIVKSSRDPINVARSMHVLMENLKKSNNPRREAAELTQ